MGGHTILMVTNNYTPYSGGVVASIQSLATELRNRGYRVVIVTFAFEKNAPQEEHIERIRCLARVRYKENIIPIPLFLKSQMRTIFERWKPDLVHVHHPFGLGPIALSCARASGVPVVFTHHTLYPEYAHYVPLPAFLIKPIIKKLVYSFCQKVDHVIAPTPSVKKYLIDQGFSGPISVISSGILPAFVQHGPKVKPVLSDRPLRLLTVSRFVPEKNVQALLSMFKLFTSNYPDRCQLKLVGFGPMLNTLRNYAYWKLRLSDEQVIFIEKPSKQELIRAYQEADLFVFASRSETQGIVLAEAFSQSTPVIAFAGCGVNDVVVEGMNGFLVNNEREMVEKLLFLTKNQTLLSELQKKAFDVSKSYYPDRIAKVFEALYNRYYNVSKL